MRRIAVGALALLALVAQSVGVAFAGAPVDRFHEPYDIVIEDFELCGFQVTAHFSGQTIGLVKPDPGNLDTLLLGTLQEHVHECDRRGPDGHR